MTRDCFGRVVTTHRCPVCLASFLGPGECRPCPANGYAHPAPVQTERIVGCDPPPDQRWVIALAVNVMASTYEMAAAMAARQVAETFPTRVAERVGPHLLPVALETRAQAVERSLGQASDLITEAVAAERLVRFDRATDDRKGTL